MRSSKNLRTNVGWAAWILSASSVMLCACDQRHVSSVPLPGFVAPQRIEALSAPPGGGGLGSSPTRGSAGWGPASEPSNTLVRFVGTCDASGALPLDPHRLVVADDEDNVLRVYDVDRGGSPLLTFDLSPELDVRMRKKPEADIEGATRLGDDAYFVTSHGLTKSGKRDPDRFLYFATTLPKDGRGVSVLGRPYRRLLDDLLRHPLLRDLNLHEAASRAPSEAGGLNLEGLTRAADGSFLLGFRSPVPRGKALVVRLENPRGTLFGERARLSGVRLLDLGERGVRALSSFRGRFLVLAGPAGAEGSFALFDYDGDAGVERVPHVEFADLNPEAFFSSEERERILVLSDDGTRMIDGVPCKKLRDPERKSFRGLWIDLNPLAPPRGDD